MTGNGMINGERQVAPTLEGIRRDHRARYEFVARHIGRPSGIIDFACGVGYGCHVLAADGHRVEGIDRDADAIEYASEHWTRDGVRFQRGDDQDLAGILGDSYDVATCFEAIEHLQDPLPMLRHLRRLAPILYASVPNEDRFPFQGQRFHFRHYRRGELEALLGEAGWRVTDWWGQAGPESEVEPGVDGRTIVVRAVRAPAVVASEPAPTPAAAPAHKRPPEGSVGHVAILGLGPSLATYVDMVKKAGGRHALFDQVWAINALGDALACDRVFHMDDLRIQEIRARANPEGHIAQIVEWLKVHPGPIVTSRAYPDAPGMVEYPLEAVVNDVGFCYFNSTAAYAVASAIHERATAISLYGLDFAYAKSHSAEKGRGNVEFLLGIAAERGIEISIPEMSSLMDTSEPEDTKVYGFGRFGTRDVTLRLMPDGRAAVELTERATLPTAEEIEAAYDHSAPTVPRHLLATT